MKYLKKWLIFGVPLFVLIAVFNELYSDIWNNSFIKNEFLLLIPMAAFEELTKLYLAKDRSKKSVIISAITFSILEIILYIFTAKYDSLMTLIVSRAVYCTTIHVISSLLSRKVLLAGIFFHAGYNILRRIISDAFMFNFAIITACYFMCLYIFYVFKNESNK